MILRDTEKSDCYWFTTAVSINLKSEYNRYYTEDGEGHKIRNKDILLYYIYIDGKKKTSGDSPLRFLTECGSVGFLEIAEDG